MALIDVSHLSFAYDGSYDYVFEDVSFKIDTDWKLGFIGRNGKGKTTFLQLLMGRYEFQGSISAPVPFEYFPFPVENPGLDTLNVLEDVCREAPEWKLRQELMALEVNEEILYRPFDTLSNGERTKALLAAMFLRENHFLLIDEPTNHLDLKGRALVSRYLSRKKGFILVSHDRAFLDQCVDHILSINRSNIEVQRGNFSSWWENKNRQDSFELAENEKLKKEVKRLRETAREKSNWSDRIEATKVGQGHVDRGWIGHQSARMMKRAKAIEGRRQAALNEKAKLLKNIEAVQTLKMSQQSYHANRLLSLRDVVVDYGDGPVCAPVTFTAARGERIAIVGRNGSGKSSILKLICGEDIPYSGIFERGSQLKVSYVPQDTSGLTGSLADYAREHGIDESRFKTVLRELDFERVQFEKDMAAFSAGQKKKVLIARSLCEDAHIHIWDEPMNYIDVFSRMQIEELLSRFQPTILFVEHDRAFCDAIASKTVTLL